MSDVRHPISNTRFSVLFHRQTHLLTAALLLAGCSFDPPVAADADDGSETTWTIDGTDDARDARTPPADTADVPPPLDTTLGDTGSDATADTTSDVEPDTGGQRDTDPPKDSDGDGISDEAEQSRADDGFITDPNAADSDGDGVDDGQDPAPTVKACNESLLFHDHFQRGLHPDWMPVHGTWKHHENGFYRNTDEVAGAVTWIGDRSWKDYVIRFRMRPSKASGDSGIGFRTQSVSAQNNGGSQYYLGLYPGEDAAVLGTMDGGWRPEHRAEIAVEPGEWHVVFIDLSGSEVGINIAGQSVFRKQLDTHDRGAISLRTYHNPTDYDDLIVCR